MRCQCHGYDEPSVDEIDSSTTGAAEPVMIYPIPTMQEDETR